MALFVQLGLVMEGCNEYVMNGEDPDDTTSIRNRADRPLAGERRIGLLYCGARAPAEPGQTQPRALAALSDPPVGYDPDALRQPGDLACRAPPPGPAPL